MKKLLLAAAMLGGGLLCAAPAIEKLDYPETVRAGEPFRLTVTASAPGTETLTCTFNGETRVIPPGFHTYAAKEFAAKYSKIEADGAVTAGSNYHTLLSFPFPQDGGSYTVWVRASGGSLCLRRPGKELKWSFGRSDAFRWINFGSWNSEKAGPALSLMSEKPPYARVDRIILTTAPATEYKPSGDGAPLNRFTWTPGASAAGRHSFEVTVSAGGETVKRAIEVTVLPPASEKAEHSAPAAAAAEAQRPVDLAGLSVKPADYPLFDFFGREFKKLLESKPFGLGFTPGGMVALRCNAYPALPDTVEIPINTKAAGIALLLTEYWQGDVTQEMAHIRVRYADGSEERVPLREEFELCGSLRNREPQAALYAGTFSSGQAEFHVTVLPWVNPHPQKEIASLVFSNIRMVVSKEENKLIPLNVTAESSQLLLGALLLDRADDAGRLAAAAGKKRQAHSDTVDVTVDFGSPEGKIHPNVFSTNETGVLSSDDPKFDEYLEKMKSVGCRLYRFHSGWNLERVYPDRLENPQYEKLAQTISKLKGANPGWDVMICFNRIPSYVDPKTPEGRRLFASLCADLVRELNVKRKFNLRYWEIYNEVYFKKIEEDRSLWKMYNEAAAAMRKVDPSIKIGGYAPCWPSVSAIRDFYRHCGAETDFISYHKYLTGSVKTPTAYLMDGAASFGADARAIRAMAEKERPGKPVELALTEYNINFNWKPHDPRQANRIGAAWFASVLYHLVKADVEIAQTWHSRGGGTFGLFSAENEPRPVAAVFALANRYVRGEHLKSASSSPEVECLAFRNPEQLGLLLVNKSDRELTVKLDLLNLPPQAPDPVLPSVESVAVREERVDSGKLPALPVELRLKPYEVRLLAK
ncbi:MAG: hypothetical protein HPZ91_18700 [Lentisphaeria bacterium]|nr:hypothetical protein [Lentisphaeria bacterium]